MERLLTDNNVCILVLRFLLTTSHKSMKGVLELAFDGTSLLNKPK